MKVITAPEKYYRHNHEITCFLAGGITNCPEWQKKVIEQLSKKLPINTDKLVIFNPRRDDFPIGDKTAAYEQIEWEFGLLDRCDIFSMYFSSGNSDQPICMYELGRNIVRMQNRFPSDWENRIIISVEDGYRRKQDVLIQTSLATRDSVSVNTQVSNDMSISYHAEMIYGEYMRLKYGR